MLRYLKGSCDFGLVYTASDTNSLHVKGYCDSDYAADLDKRRSLNGYIFTFGDNVISWKSCLQHIVALSTTEAEYVALTEATKEALWLKGITEELGLHCGIPVIYCDSQSAIHLSKNSAFHERTKHIDVRLHFIREILSRGQVILEKIASEVNPADILTKVVPINKFKSALDLLQIGKL